MFYNDSNYIILGEAKTDNDIDQEHTQRQLNDYVNEARTYDADRNIKVGYYKRYTVDELITKAKDILQGAELSDELKSQYGIED